MRKLKPRKRVNTLWEVRWSKYGEEVGEDDWLWVIGRNVNEASSKGQKFLNRKYYATKITGVTANGTIDVF